MLLSRLTLPNELPLLVRAPPIAGRLPLPNELSLLLPLPNELPLPLFLPLPLPNELPPITGGRFAAPNDVALLGLPL